VTEFAMVALVAVQVATVHIGLYLPRNSPDHEASGEYSLLACADRAMKGSRDWRTVFGSPSLTFISECLFYDHGAGKELQALSNSPCSRASDCCHFWHYFCQDIPSSFNKRGENVA